MKTLHIDFDLYTDGDDDFKQELVSLIVADIKELQKCLALTAELNELNILHRGLHKSKTTLEMINDPELVHLLDEFKMKIENGKTDGHPSSPEIGPLVKLFEELIESLSELNKAA
jgi:hypothetical protein